MSERLTRDELFKITDRRELVDLVLRAQREADTCARDLNRVMNENQELRRRLVRAEQLAYAGVGEAE
jgi:hypothetical protein